LLTGPNTFFVLYLIYIKTDEENIPTGQKLNVDGTIYDFRRGSYLSADLLSRTPEGYGYDLNYCYPDDGQYRQAAILVSPRTGRLLEVKTTQPGKICKMSEEVPLFDLK
jgi:aldose 1-epimerase